MVYYDGSQCHESDQQSTLSLYLRHRYLWNVHI